MNNPDRIFRVVLAIVCLLAEHSAFATIISWTNTSGGDWSVVSNWDPNQAPGVADTAVITNNGMYTVILDSSVSVGSLTLGGTSGIQTLTNGNTTLTLSSPSFVNTNGILALRGGILNGSGHLSVEGVMVWSGGIILDAPMTIGSNGVLKIRGNESYLRHALTNAGTVLWTGGPVYMANDGTTYFGAVENLAGGLWDIACDSAMYEYSGNRVYFHNAGTLIKTAGTGGTYFSAFTGLSFSFTNTGTLTVQSGAIHFDNPGNFGGNFAAAASGTEINFNDGGSLKGNFSAAAGATINLVGGVFAATPSLAFNGSGINRMSGGSLTLADDIIPNLQLLGGTISLSPSFQGGSITNLTLDGPNLSGSHTVSGTFNFQGLPNGTGASGSLRVDGGGVMNWSGGVVRSLTVASNGAVNIGGSETYLWGPLTNAGIVTWVGGTMYLANDGVSYLGAVENLAGGLWNIACDRLMNAYVGNNAYFHNAGTTRKIAANGTTSLFIPFNNVGTVEGLSGNLSFLGGYTNQPSANLAVSLGGVELGTNYGHLQFTNTLTAAGTFTISTRNGFRPSPGDTFDVLSYQSATNEFACINGLDLGGGLLLLPQFTLTNLTLTAATYDTNDVLPRLFITSSPSGVSVTWPFGFPNWTLESTTNLSTSFWESVSLQCENQAVVPLKQQQYFRLKAD